MLRRINAWAEWISRILRGNPALLLSLEVIGGIAIFVTISGFILHLIVASQTLDALRDDRVDRARAVLLDAVKIAQATNQDREEKENEKIAHSIPGLRESMEFLVEKGFSLHRVYLRGTRLEEFELAGADLHGAELVKAVLVEAELEGADLRGATLQRANLCGADLSGALLEGADVEDATLCWTNLSDADLKDVANLKPNQYAVACMNESTPPKNIPKCLQDIELNRCPNPEKKQGICWKETDRNRNDNYFDKSKKCTKDFDKKPSALSSCKREDSQNSAPVSNPLPAASS